MGKKSDLLNKMLSETANKKDFDLSRKQEDEEDTRFDEVKFSSFSLDNDTEDMDEDEINDEPSPTEFKGNSFFFEEKEESDPEPIPTLPIDEPISTKETNSFFIEPQDQIVEEPDNTSEPVFAPVIENKIEQPVEEIKQPVKTPVSQEITSANSNVVIRKENNMENMTEVDIQILRKILSQTVPNFEGLEYLSQEELNRIWNNYKNSI